jgi:hypothetical protein
LKGKILFLASNNCDYLSDSIFHGLRTLLGNKLVDYPKAERMYKTAPRELIAGLRGNGFTLYGLLDDIEVERPIRLDEEQIAKDYDLIVVSDIRRQHDYFTNWRNVLNEENTVILDGSDPPSLYKYAGPYWRHPELWNLPGTGRIPYFKRELMPETLAYRWYLTLPKAVAAQWMRFAPFKKTAFAIPEEKIVTSLPAKDKLMASHIVDPEVAAHFNGASTGYAFNTEAGYYGDLRRSHFAITTKREGWDCLRHYEITANGCVPCFRDLDLKSSFCAPHGLTRKNCIVYTSLADLLTQLEAITPEKYALLQEASLLWAKNNTTVYRAMDLLFASGHSDWLVTDSPCSPGNNGTSGCNQAAK